MAGRWHRTMTPRLHRIAQNALNGGEQREGHRKRVGHYMLAPTAKETRVETAATDPPSSNPGPCRPKLYRIAQNALNDLRLWEALPENVWASTRGQGVGAG